MDNFRDPFQVGELDTLRAENARLAMVESEET